MHLPSKWRIEELSVCYDFIKTYGFATLVTSDLNASQIPLVLDLSADKPALLGHVSAANEHARTLDNAQALAIFMGPHAYISPTWYESKPAVPTWNYSSVHVTGVTELLDSEATLKLVNKLIRQYEPSLLEQPEILTSEYQKKLNKGIVGFRLTIESIEGKEKLGQHRSLADQRGVVSGLQNSISQEEQSLLRYMISRNLGLGK
ncbi:FMN-binding negative transcriptional regulator [Pleionea sediminis]|uniref:FMN-binding negative transcriptional regulator n=1 Tax=Pleionea sediminis TaxID=2569479 RepID=UPI001186ADFE|nr:FMN-binding negative transcriptional regulator [Pleionea sediminis]